MHALVALVAAGLLVLAGETRAADVNAGPQYSSASLVNAADNQTGPLAPNVIATLYGTGLAYGTKALTADDIRGGVLPTVLPGTGVRVLISGIPANLYYVSPGQINFLVPPNLVPGTVNLEIVLDGLAGPSIAVPLAPGRARAVPDQINNPVAFLERRESRDSHRFGRRVERRRITSSRSAVMLN